jgi:membrane protease YdiL (CAAX protease family)
MRAFGDRVPAWPVLAGVAALAGAALIAAFAPLLAAVPGVAAGAGRSSPAIVLLGAALAAGGIVVLVARLARLTRPVSAAQLGLRAPDDLARALLLAAGAVLALAALAAAWRALGDPRGAFAIPPELDTRSVAAQTYDLPVRDPVAFGPGLLASALARCVLPVVAGEILVRGFAFPALSQWRGPVVSALIVSVLFGGIAQLAGAPGVAALSMLLGVLLCGLYLVTGSLLPGIALAAVASAIGLGVACVLPVVEIAVLAAVCGAAALALAAGPRLPQLSPSRRPWLRGSEA